MPLRFDWDDFRLVQAIAETGSLNGAAEKLGLNHSTVFRRLGAIEETVGQKLFDRLRAGYEPTAVGADMAALAEKMSAGVSEFERRLAACDPAPAGDLRVATNDTLATYLLPQICAGFRELYPAVRLDLVVGNAATNLSRRDADVALRATPAPLETLVGRRIAELHWAVYAAPELRARHPDPDAPDAPWIGYGEAMRALPVARSLDERVGAERIVYRTSSVVGQVEAASARIGFAALPCFVGDVHPGVERVGAPYDIGRALWMLTHEDLRHSARVRAFMAYFGDELSKRKKLFEGGGL